MRDLSHGKLELLRQKKEIEYYNEHEEIENAMSHSVLN